MRKGSVLLRVHSRANRTANVRDPLPDKRAQAITLPLFMELSAHRPAVLPENLTSAVLETPPITRQPLLDRRTTVLRLP